MSKLHTFQVITIAALLFMTAVAQAANLPTLTGSPASYDAIVAGHQTVVLLATTDACTDCPGVQALLQQEQTKHPEYKFVTGDAEGWGIPSGLVPFLLVIQPHNGVILRRSNFSPKRIEDVDSVLARLKH